MRYNHFTMLPERAFQKRGFGFTRPSTLEGGGGGIISSIGNAVSSAVSGIGHAVEDVGKSVSNVGVGIDKSVRSAVPGGWATIGAVAATVLTAGAASGALAAGEGAALAGEGAAAAGAAEGAAGVGAAGAAEAGTAAGADVFGGLAGTSGEIGGGAAAATEGTAAAGAQAAAANAALDPLSWDAAAKAALSGAGKGAIMGGLSSAAQGRDPLTGALMGAATGGIGAGAGNIAGQFGAGTIGSGIAGGAAGSGTGALLSGKDAGNAALIGGLTGGITAGIGSLTGSKVAGSAASPFVKSLIAQGINGTPSSPQRTMMNPSTYYRPITSSSSLLQNPNVSGYAASSSLLPSFSSQYLSSQDPTQNDVQSIYDQGILKADLGAGSQQSNFIIPNYKKDESLLPHYAAGQTVGNTQTNTPVTTNELLADLGKSTPNFTLIEKPYSPSTIKTYADGGEVIDHKPEFFSEGGLNSLKHSYVKGDGDGTSDSVPAMLANGEFVIPADVVSSLGNGSNDSGSKVLSEFLSTIRAHKQKHDSKHLPPDSKGPLSYLTDAKRKLKV